MIFGKNCEWFANCLKYDRSNDSLLPSPLTGLPLTHVVPYCKLKKGPLPPGRGSRLQDAHWARGVWAGSQPPGIPLPGLCWAATTCAVALPMHCCGSRQSEVSALSESSRRPDLPVKGKKVFEISESSHYLSMKSQVLTLWSEFLGLHLTYSLTSLMLLS